MLTAALYSGLAAMASALARLADSPFLLRAPPAERALGGGSDAAAEGGPDGTPGIESDGFVSYTLDVVFTPYGPELLHFWIPTSVAGRTQSELRKGDLE